MIDTGQEERCSVSLEFETIRERMAEYLNSHGIDAVSAYPDSGRLRRKGVVAAVSLRACQGGPGGFQDYLGERYDQESGQWQELYGRKMVLTFGLDLYAPQKGGAAEIQAAFDRMVQALRQEGPVGLRLLELSCGETEFDQEVGLYHRKVEALCQGYLYAVATEGGEFLDFIVRGESRI